jgi:hypothetical protein
MNQFTRFRSYLFAVSLIEKRHIRRSLTITENRSRSLFTRDLSQLLSAMNSEDQFEFIEIIKVELSDCRFTSKFAG